MKATKQITLRYEINGSKFKRKFSIAEAPDAIVRANVLRENGIEVKVSGMPKRVSIETALAMAGTKGGK